MNLDVGLMTFALGDVAACARRAEEAGFGAIWSAETRHDPFLPLAVAATATSRLGLGTAIAVAFPRSPMVLAHIAWDLQKASGGRFVLGLGSQVKAHNERRFSVPWEPPGPRIREIVQALRAIWECWQTGARLDFHGRSYRFDLMTPFFDPGPIEPPADPSLPGRGEPADVPDRGRGGGRPARPLLPQRAVPARVRASRGAGGARARRPLAGRLHLPGLHHGGAGRLGGAAAAARPGGEAADRLLRVHSNVQPVLAAHGLKDLAPRLHARSLAGDWEGMADLITDEMLDLFAVSGPFEEIGERIRERYRGLYDRTQLYPSFQPSLDDPRWPVVLSAFGHA